MKILHALSAVIALSATGAALAQQNTANTQPPESAEDRDSLPQSTGVVTLGTTVTGNQEQPKVLYIVPWQAAQDERILYEPLNSQTNRVFSHIERSEHLRELEFISELGGNIGE